MKPPGTGASSVLVMDGDRVALRLTDASDVAQFAQALAERMTERDRLDETLAAGLLEMAAQPIVRFGDDGTHAIGAYEALLRPGHPVWDQPGPLLDAAERQSRMGELGSIVAALAARWLERIPEPARLFVNLHPHQLADPARLERELAPLLPHARRVVLEITERSRLVDLGGWEETVAHVGALGFAIAVDDLGAGWSSLDILALVQPEFIKIDMSLVRGVDAAPRKRRLVELVHGFAEATGAHVVAEGVETAAEAGALLDVGVRWMQGFWFGRPESWRP